MYSMLGKSQKPISIVELADMNSRCEKIGCLTADDSSFAAIMDNAGLDVVLVGDSLGAVIQGKETTLPMIMDDMVYHTRCVSNGCRRALIVSDMPFVSYATPDLAIANAA